MTARATDRLAPSRRPVVDCFRNRFVTVPACVLGYIVIARRDAQRIRKVARREIERMPEAIARFGHVLADHVVRRVAIVADRNRAVTRLCPRCIVLAHDVAIRAGRRIVRHVRGSARVHVRKGADTDRHSQQHNGGGEQPASHVQTVLLSMRLPAEKCVHSMGAVSTAGCAPRILRGRSYGLFGLDRTNRNR